MASSSVKDSKNFKGAPYLLENIKIFYPIFEYLHPIGLVSLFPHYLLRLITKFKICF